MYRERIWGANFRPFSTAICLGALLLSVAVGLALVSPAAASAQGGRSVQVHARLSLTKGPDGSLTARAVLSSENQACLTTAYKKGWTQLSVFGFVFTDPQFFETGDDEFDLPRRPTPNSNVLRLPGTVGSTRLQGTLPGTQIVPYKVNTGMAIEIRQAPVSQATEAVVSLDVAPVPLRASPYAYRARTRGGTVNCLGRTWAKHVPL